MKKITAIVLALMMVLLVGCGNSESQTNKTDPVVSATEKTTEAITEKPTEKQTEKPTEAHTEKPTEKPVANQSVDKYVLETYTDENEMSGGYSYNVTLKIGSWVKATETETINNIWESIGGSGSVPDINSFTYNSWSSGVHFGKGTSIMAFGTVAIEDTTQGGFSLSDTSNYISVDVFSYGLTKGTLVDSYIQTSNGGSYLHSAEGRNNRVLHVYPEMKKRTWGPVPFVICANEAISPEYPDGKPDVINATWSFGDNEFNVYPMWSQE